MSTPASRRLDAVARDILGPIMDLEVPSRTGWRLIGWDAEHGVSLTLANGDRVLLIELEARDDQASRESARVCPACRGGGTST